tara:strand:- start:37 stop:975 length:939 start_codon:yes stop_codon:yes gene_type:complete
MTNLYKTFDDSFKKEVNALIRKGIIDMKKEMPEGAIYSSSKKPPKDAQVYRTARGTEYWVPGKEQGEQPSETDSTPKQAKPGKLTRSKTTISDIKSESKEQGSHFFDKDTMKFFGSKVASPIYEKDGKKYFITSEKRPNSDEPRKYTVRQIVYYDKKGNPAKSGTQFIESVDGFQLHDSLQAAKNALAGTKGKAKEDTPKTGREQFTPKQRIDLAQEAHASYEALGPEARELYLIGKNDADIYRQRETPIIDNLKKKMKKGVYERASAEKLAKYMFDDVAKKEGFGTPDERREAAANWVKWFESDYADGQYD